MFDLFQVNGNKIEAPGMDLQEAYTTLREAIMDAKIPVSMPIGFKLVTYNSLDSTTAVERNSACLESMVAISTNVKDIVFIGDRNTLVQSASKTGVVCAGNAEFSSKDKQEVRAIDSSTLLFTAVEPLRIRFFVYKDAGYRSMEKNAKTINEEGFFPLNTTHSLLSYVRVMPFNGTSIQVAYRKGMTAEIFSKILKGGM